MLGKTNLTNLFLNVYHYCIREILFMKKIFLLFVALGLLGVLMQSSNCANAAKTAKKTGSPLWKLDTSAKSNYQQISNGDTQDTVIQKMGQPNIVTELNDGSQLWVYTRVTKSANTRGASANTNNTMSMGTSAFNAQIASNGFGYNMYNNIPVTQMIPAQPEDYYTTKTTKVKFTPSGKVENFVESVE